MALEWFLVVLIVFLLQSMIRKRRKNKEKELAEIADSIRKQRQSVEQSSLTKYNKSEVLKEEIQSDTSSFKITLSVSETPSKLGQSFNDKVEASQKQKNAKLKDPEDPLSNIDLEEIHTYLGGLRPLIGKDYVKSRTSDHRYEIDLGEQSCSCEHFLKKDNFPKNDARRFCYHMIEVFDRRNAFDKVEHRTRMVAELASSSKVISAYALQHTELPLMYLLIESENPWINVYAREKKSGENIYNASGDFYRHGYNIIEKRWSYGWSVSGISLINHFMKSINTLDDIDDAVEKIRNRPKISKLTEKIDPRINPNYNSDQYGPEHDNWEIPESSLQYEWPCDCSLLFSYTDGKGGRSRRTVDFKKLQNYGSEGTFLYGECRMRKAGRTFNTNRMTNAIDVRTGELIDDISNYAEKVWQESTKAKLLKWAEDNDLIAKAFLFLLKGNKRAAATDYKVLAAIFSEALGGVEVTSSDIQYLYMDMEPTTAVGFQRLVGGIIKHNPDLVSWFKENAQRLGNVRANPNFADQAAVEYVKKRIP